MLFFNVYIQSTMKGYLNFGIATLLSLSTVFLCLLQLFQPRFSDPVALVSTVLMAFYLLSAPFATYLLLNQNKRRLNEDKFQVRFGALYQNLRPEDFRAVFVSVLFFARRLIYTFSIVFFGSAPLLQAMIQVVCSMFLIMYMLICRPFIEKEIFYFELFNEATLLSCSYFLIVFCDILMDYDKRMSVGWYMTVVTLFNILANWVNMVLSLIA